MPEPLLITEIAQQLRRNSTTILSWAKSGLIPFTYRANSEKRLFVLEDVLSAMEANGLKLGSHPRRTRERPYRRIESPIEKSARVRHVGFVRKAAEFGCACTASMKDVLEILLNDERCFYCERPFSEQMPANIDHKIPFTLRGPHSKENMVAACRSCNSKKSNRTPEEFAELKARPPVPKGFPTDFPRATEAIRLASELLHALQPI